MDSTVQTLTLYFAGSDGTQHMFRINDLRQEVDVAKANAALDTISATGAFVGEDGSAYYATPLQAVVTTTITKTIVQR